jgi:hypothetical protein
MANSTADRPLHPHRLASARRQILRPSRDSATRQAAVAMMRGALEKAGVDLSQVEEMRSRSRAELQTVLARYRAEADGRAPAMQTVVARSASTGSGAIALSVRSRLRTVSIRSPRRMRSRPPPASI